MSSAVAEEPRLDGSRAPLTKFRIPRLHPDIVARPRVVMRLVDSAQSNPVTVVTAPGGSGKTTALAQLAASLDGGAAVLWISIDGEDNDANRLFAALVQAVEPLKLVWEVDPQALLAGVAGMTSQSRAALAALVNALCTSSAPRIVLIIDDLHRLDSGEVFELLESLVERLPEHVTVVLGSRVEPALPLARWQAHRELGAFSLKDLRFDEAEARALAEARQDGVVSEESIREALRRTHGWAVGLTMMLHAGHTDSAGAPHREVPGGTVRGLYGYLAQEILAELSPAEQDFVIRCAILPELTPDNCRAVTGRDDAAQLLDSLYRRNLFLTAIDEVTPVLRFHDLFRDYLQTELRRRHAGELAELHLRAARAERVPARAVHHFIEAHSWQEAIALIADVGETLIADGATATLGRWIAELPESVRSGNAHLAYLMGTIGWLHWDWAVAESNLRTAVSGLTDPVDDCKRVRARLRLADVFSSSGDDAGATRMLDEAEQIALDDLGQAELALQRAWCLARECPPGPIVAQLEKFLVHAERDPVTIYPITASLFHGLLVGVPGVSQIMERYVHNAERVQGRAVAAWHLTMTTTAEWTHLWHGERALAAASIARGDEMHHQFRGIRSVADRHLQVKAVFNAAIGNIGGTLALAQGLLEGLKAPDAAVHSASWRRTYVSALCRCFWMAGDRESWSRMQSMLLVPRGNEEWPYADVAMLVVRGQDAMWREDYPAAIEWLSQALPGFALCRVPPVYCDPRISLAYCHLTLNDRAAAWRAFEPVLTEATQLRALGNLVLDSQRHVAAIFEALPAEIASAAATRAVRAKLDDWWRRDAAHEAASRRPTAGSNPLGVLSEREKEVLSQVAAGASNKHIARALDLSLHTVKRHLCNILDKLDCASRGQAADLYRRHAPA